MLISAELRRWAKMPDRATRPPYVIIACTDRRIDVEQEIVSARKKTINRLLEQLDLAADLRAKAVEGTKVAVRRRCLRVWQAQRLTRTHADLLSSARFGATASFFLTDIYGPEDLSQHEAEIKRILPVMTKLLPASGLETVADAIELSTLSEKLDMAMIKSLGEDAEALDVAIYGKSYRTVGRRRERQHQIDLIDHLGRSLDDLIRRPFVGKALSLMHRPAILAGLGDLQDFLERGYAAFRKLDGADEFLRIVVTRENRIMEALFAGDDSVLKA